MPRRLLDPPQSAALQADLSETPNIFEQHTKTASGKIIPFKQALLVALAAGLGYGFDSYAVNIFGMLSP